VAQYKEHRLELKLIGCLDGHDAHGVSPLRVSHSCTHRLYAQHEPSEQRTTGAQGRSLHL